MSWAYDSAGNPTWVPWIVGTPSSGQYLKWDGSKWIPAAGAAGGTSGSGTATIDFGAAPGSSLATVTVSGQTGLTGTGAVEAWIQGDSTATHNAYEHLIAPILLRVGGVTVGAFTVYASTELRLTGTFTIHWYWSN